jgi:hypothetical protein
VSRTEAVRVEEAHASREKGESTPASSPTPGRPGLQVRGDGDQVDHHDRHQYYGGHAPGIAFQDERLAVFPGELLVGERRTMSSGGAARWST